MSKNKNNTIKNFDVRFCKCGRIHFLNRDEIYEAVDKNRETLFICSGCGTAIRIGADDYFDGGKAMYSIDLKPGGEITKKKRILNVLLELLLENFILYSKKLFTVKVIAFQ